MFSDQIVLSLAAAFRTSAKNLQALQKIGCAASDRLSAPKTAL
jgi:hypothetical protein